MRYVFFLLFFTCANGEETVFDLLQSEHEEIGYTDVGCSVNMSCWECLNNECEFHKSLASLSPSDSICLVTGAPIPKEYYVYTSHLEISECDADIPHLTESTTTNVIDCQQEWDCALCLSNGCNFFLAMPQFSPSTHFCTKDDNAPRDYVIHTSVVELESCKNYFQTQPVSTPKTLINTQNNSINNVKGKNERKGKGKVRGKGKGKQTHSNTFAWITATAVVSSILLIITIFFLVRLSLLKRQRTIPFRTMNETTLQRSLQQVEEESIRLNPLYDDAVTNV